MSPLNDASLVAFLVTTDATRARAFYEGALGLTFVSEDEFALVLTTQGTKVRVTKMKEWSPLPFTVLGWDVADVDASARQLVARGVRLERYGFLEQDEAGVWTAPSGTKVVWFKDPDGNTLSLSSR
jgi:catechol 2,3-dioxygenase-like lactoylglutathione lyase family enzyme